MPLPDDLDGPYALDVVVRADEIVAMQEATAAFNAIIAEEATAHHAPVVDVNALLNYVDTFGLWVDGRHLTTDFLGGVFTLDGIHPTNTAHAVIANAFIRVLNQRFRAHIRPVSVKAVMADDPLVFVPATEGHRASFHSIGGRAMNNIDGGR